MNLSMVDLKSQYLKIKNEIDSSIQKVLDNTTFINGPQVSELTENLKKYMGSEYVIPCANGTDAIQIALMAMGLEPGDEVITPSYTYIATVEVVGLLKLTPKFVDVDKDTFTMNIDDLRAKITSKTKAIIPVHLYGQCANMEEILAIAKEHNLYVLEDTAQAIGANYTFSDGTIKKAGTMGHVGTTSFFPSKNLGCYGDGGAIFTNDSVLAEKMKMIANHGQSERYVHDIVGCNSRLDSIQAAVLNVKLPYLDGYCDARRKVADFYDEKFANNPYITTPFRASYSTHVFHQYTLILENVNRDEVKEKLEAKNIPSMIYYPIACHNQKMFSGFNLGNMNLQNTDYLTPRVLSLPIHTEMNEEQLNYITSNLLTILK